MIRANPAESARAASDRRGADHAASDVGDSWSLLIVRDLMFKGLCAFNEFAGAGESIATNVLADRLAKLEGNGILAKQADPTDARRIRYRLTEKGIDLAPVLIEIVLWSSRYEDTGAPASAVRAMRKIVSGLLPAFASIGRRAEWF